jgi:hypothetical protein
MLKCYLVRFFDSKMWMKYAAAPATQISKKKIVHKNRPACARASVYSCIVCTICTVCTVRTVCTVCTVCTHSVHTVYKQCTHMPNVYNFGASTAISNGSWNFYIKFTNKIYEPPNLGSFFFGSPSAHAKLLSAWLIVDATMSDRYFCR